MKRLISARLYESEVNKARRIIPAGTELYHATGEQFSPQALRPGGYDKIMWTTQEPAVSQTYIPTGKGMKSRCTTANLLRLDDKTDEEKLRSIGLEYTNVEYNGSWGQASTWTPPKAFKVLWDEFGHDDRGREKRRCEIVNEHLEAMGYEPKRTTSNHPCEFHWELRTEASGAIKRGDETRYGRLLVVVPRTDLLFFDYTLGGATEADENDLEYNKHHLFQQVEAEGYDGIIINDFAQSRDQGNFAHVSLGLFKAAIAKCDVHEIEQAQHYDLGDFHRSGNYNTPEYLAWKQKRA